MSVAALGLNVHPHTPLQKQCLYKEKGYQLYICLVEKLSEESSKNNSFT